MYDLILKGGRLIDPAQGIDTKTDIAFSAGKVAKISEDIDASQAAHTRDVSGCIVSPGLIDLHTHVYWGGTSLGVDSDTIAKRSGTATFVDAGSAGAGNMAGFREHVIRPSKPRILAYINVSFPGIYAFSKTVMVGECEDLRLLDTRECLRVARENKDIVVGVKARVGFHAGKNSGAAPLDMAIEVADELNLPVMAHIDFPPPSRDEVLSRLRPGDILTHCCRSFPNAPIDRDKRIRPEILEARERGIIFDIGHGFGGFSFESGKAFLDQGFPPDVISSDVHVLSVDGPAHDVLAVMSKFLCMGMDLVDVIGAATAKPAEVLRRNDIGTLSVGSVGDATIIKLTDGEFDYIDAMGEVLKGNKRLAYRGLVLGGEWWHDGEASI